MNDLCVCTNTNIEYACLFVRLQESKILKFLETATIMVICEGHT
jgi:hypothetical protein